MIENRKAVDLIERAQDATPYCPCGRHATIVERAGRIWLECSALEDRRDTAVARVIWAITANAHLRRLVLDLRPVAA